NSDAVGVAGGVAGRDDRHATRETRQCVAKLFLSDRHLPVCNLPYRNTIGKNISFDKSVPMPDNLQAMERTEEFFAGVSRDIDAALERLIPAVDVEPVRLHEAVRWSLFGGGKRIRPA